MRIGLVAFGDKQWMGGVYYITNLIRAVRLLPLAEQPELFLVASPEVANVFYADVLDQVEEIDYSIANERRTWWARTKHVIKRLLLTTPVTTRLVRAAGRAGVGTPFQSLAPLLRSRGISLLFPCTESLGPKFGLPWIAWAYDLQHHSHPEFFDEEEIARRDRVFEAMAREAPLIVLSSEHARESFGKLWPAQRHKLRVLHFHTVAEAEWFRGDVGRARAAYDLPERYLMLPNQFWVHKNHRLVFEALDLLKHQGTAATLVCTGHTDDPRHPEYFAQLTQELKSSGLDSQVRILGLIPRADQIQLMRGAMTIIQPSLFEGWSTVVEDARALGKRLVLSDIAVHREQNPDGAVYFDPHSVSQLAGHLQTVWVDWPPGPNQAAELSAEAAQQTRLLAYGRQFLALARESARPG